MFYKVQFENHPDNMEGFYFDRIAEAPKYRVDSVTGKIRFVETFSNYVTDLAEQSVIGTSDRCVILINIWSPITFTVRGQSYGGRCDRIATKTVGSTVENLFRNTFDAV